MNPEKHQLISELALNKEDKRQKFQWLNLMNVKHDPEERKQQVIDYSLAEAELYEASEKLRRAIQE